MSEDANSVYYKQQHLISVVAITSLATVHAPCVSLEVWFCEYAIDQSDSEFSCRQIQSDGVTKSHIFQVRVSTR